MLFGKTNKMLYNQINDESNKRHHVTHDNWKINGKSKSKSLKTTNLTKKGKFVSNTVY